MLKTLFHSSPSFMFEMPPNTICFLYFLLLLFHIMFLLWKVFLLISCPASVTWVGHTWVKVLYYTVTWTWCSAKALPSHPSLNQVFTQICSSFISHVDFIWSPHCLPLVNNYLMKPKCEIVHPAIISAYLGNAVNHAVVKHILIPFKYVLTV